MSDTDDFNPNDWDEPTDAVDEPGLSATLAAEATPKTRRPANMPTMMPPAMLDKHRRRRADFWKFAGSDAVNALADSDGTVKMSDISTSYQALSDIEDAFRVVVIPAGRAAYEQWVQSVDDETIFQMFAWYTEEMQPGEASPSPN